MIHDIIQNPKQLEDLLNTLRGCVIGLQDHYTRLAEAIARIMNQSQNASAIADTIASIIVTDHAQRQSLLEQPCVEVRMEAIVRRLTDLLIHAPSTDDTPWKN